VCLVINSLTSGKNMGRARVSNYTRKNLISHSHTTCTCARTCARTCACTCLMCMHMQHAHVACDMCMCIRQHLRLYLCVHAHDMRTAMDMRKCAHAYALACMCIMRDLISRFFSPREHLLAASCLQISPVNNENKELSSVPRLYLIATSGVCACPPSSRCTVDRSPFWV
jgi:hypothetical protein